MVRSVATGEGRTITRRRLDAEGGYGSVRGQVCRARRFAATSAAQRASVAPSGIGIVARHAGNAEQHQKSSLEWAPRRAVRRTIS